MEWYVEGGGSEGSLTQMYHGYYSPFFATIRPPLRQGPGGPSAGRNQGLGEVLRGRAGRPEPNGAPRPGGQEPGKDMARSQHVREVVSGRLTEGSYSVRWASGRVVLRVAQGHGPFAPSHKIW